jgi:hypothetical protein
MAHIIHRVIFSIRHFHDSNFFNNFFSNSKSALYIISVQLEIKFHTLKIEVQNNSLYKYFSLS